ncbi:Uncharacterised protein [Legionella feeleii]|uniref:Uncharacterized protein n=1 Tax=Legionella feeleii TaxID=453 RepID=A0A2X1QRK6_9GAMM|nr:Uncharacterised protein [Legionella feeleii]
MRTLTDLLWLTHSNQTETSNSFGHPSVAYSFLITNGA